VTYITASDGQVTQN